MFGIGKILLLLGFVRLNYLKKMNVVFFFLSLYSAWNNIWHNIRKLFIKKERFKKNIFYYYSDNYFVPMELVLIEFTTTCRITDLLKIVLLVKDCYGWFMFVSFHWEHWLQRISEYTIPVSTL